MTQHTPGQGNILALEIVSQFCRRWWTLVAGPCIGLALALLTMGYIPKVYEASTKVLVAPPKIPQEYVRSTINDDMNLRLAALKEAVLSRPYMLFLIRETVDHPTTEAETELLMRAFRSRVEIVVSRGYFEIKYRDGDPERAARVVNMLADRYIEENAQYRALRAEDTTETLEQFAHDALELVKGQEQRIAQFKAGHLYETAEHMSANLSLLEGRRQDLVENDAAIVAAQDRLESMREALAQFTAAQANQPVATSGVADPLTSRIQRLQQDLESARARYRDDHPDVRAKQRELDDLLAGAETTEVAPDGTSVRRPARSPLTVQIQAAEREIERLQAERERIRGEIETYARRIEATPQVEQKLSELTKGFDVAQAQFRDYQAKAAAARGAQRMEESQKGEQFEVIERAVPPALPVRPIPILVYGIGFALGLCAFVGPGLVRMLLDPLICSETRLHLMTKVPVLVAMPRIASAQVRRAERRQRIRNVAYSLLAAAALIAAIAVKLVPRVS
jgi:polysaccharide chain length determinant protein (PEP-CTERM system associated)